MNCTVLFVWMFIFHFLLYCGSARPTRPYAQSSCQCQRMHRHLHHRQSAENICTYRPTTELFDPTNTQRHTTQNKITQQPSHHVVSSRITRAQYKWRLSLVSHTAQLKSKLFMYCLLAYFSVWSPFDMVPVFMLLWYIIVVLASGSVINIVMRGNFDNVSKIN